MLANKSKLIDFVCYFIIFFLILLIALPPLLRFFMNGSSISNNKTTILSIEGLRCIISDDNKSKIVKTDYKNKELTKVSITYENYDEAEIEEKLLVDIEGVSEDIEGNKILYTIEYNDRTKDNENLIQYFGKIDDLKATYEASRYTCSILTN